MSKGIEPAFPDPKGEPAPEARAQWAVCERSGAWAIALRREAAPLDLHLYETRSLADGWAVLEQAPASFLVAELTLANADALLARMAGLERQFPRARVAVVAERSLAEYEWLLREAGAVWFATSPRELKPMIALVQRHMQLTPLPARDLTQQVWDSLPWRPTV